jgi:hypothetical protein
MYWIRRVLGPLIIGAGIMTAASPALAVEPDAYVPEMPNPGDVRAAFLGSDDFDTAALRFAAFSRLEDLTKAMIGDRGPAGQAKQAEADLLASYTDSWTAIRQEVKDSLPEDQQGFYVGTRYTAWSQLVDTYQIDPSFNETFRSLFSTSFQTTYASMLDDRETADAEPLLLPFETAPLTGMAYVLDLVIDHAVFLAALAAYFVLFKLLGPSRPKQAPKQAGT